MDTSDRNCDLFAGRDWKGEFVGQMEWFRQSSLDSLSSGSEDFEESTFEDFFKSEVESLVDIASTDESQSVQLDYLFSAGLADRLLNDQLEKADIGDKTEGAIPCLSSALAAESVDNFRPVVISAGKDEAPSKTDDSGQFLEQIWNKGTYMIGQNGLKSCSLYLGGLTEVKMGNGKDGAEDEDQRSQVMGQKTKVNNGRQDYSSWNNDTKTKDLSKGSKKTKDYSKGKLRNNSIITRQKARELHLQRPYICTYDNCGKAYVKSTHLKTHLRRHSGDKPFVCTFEGCKWRFSRSDELSRHKRTHTGLRPFTCKICFKSFVRSDHLAKHTRIHDRKPL